MKIQLAKREDGPAQPWAEEHGVFWRWNDGEWHSGYPEALTRVHRLIEPVTPNIIKGDSPALHWLRQKFPYHVPIKHWLRSELPEAIVENYGRPVRFYEEGVRTFRLFDVNEVREFMLWVVCCPDSGKWAYTYGFGTHIYFKSELHAVHAKFVLS